MKRSDFFRKESRYTNDPAELERKYKRLLREQEEAFYEELRRKAAPGFGDGNTTATAGGGGGYTPPYGSGSMEFDGIDPLAGGSSLKSLSTLMTWLPGTGDYTVEWFQKESSGVQPNPTAWAIGPYGGTKPAISNDGTEFLVWPSGSTFPIGIAFDDVWIHVAFVRSSGIIRCYINGVESGSGISYATVITPSVYDFNIGSDGETFDSGFTGKITNFRWTNGVVYAANFTVPTAALTLLPATKILLLGGDVTNPAIDATGINTWVYNAVVWSPETPFI